MKTETTETTETFDAQELRRVCTTKMWNIVVPSQTDPDSLGYLVYSMADAELVAFIQMDAAAAEAWLTAEMARVPTP